MSITPLPPAPQITDTTSEFNTKAFNWVAALDPFTTEANALADQVSNDAIAAATAQDAKDAAVAAANFKGEWSTLTGALNIPASVSHNDLVWILTENLADVTAAEPGIDARWFPATEKLPVGALQYFAGPTTTTYPGDKWLLANGSVVTQTAYSDLFDRVGLIANGFENFTIRNSTTTNRQINSIVYGNDIFVFGANNGVLATSTDAITWTARTSGTASSILSLTYGNGLFVYGNIGGGLATSTDGITWTARTSGTTSAINALAYGNNLFVYAGTGGVLATSTDAITWTARTSGTTTFILSLTYGNGLFVYAGSGGIVRTSTNGIDWKNEISPMPFVAPNTIRALTYAENILFIAGDLGIIYSSNDNGTTWQSQLSNTISTIFSSVYANGVLVYGGANGLITTANKYTYDDAIEFALPKKSINADNSASNLYIKAE